MYPKFGPANDQNAIETHFQAILRPRNSMVGIVFEKKVKFLGSFGSKKGPKTQLGELTDYLIEMDAHPALLFGAFFACLS